MFRLLLCLNSFLLSIVLMCGVAYAGCETRIDGVCLDAMELMQYDGIGSEPATSPIGSARQYFDPLEGKLKCSEDGGSYVDCVYGNSDAQSATGWTHFTGLVALTTVTDDVVIGTSALSTNYPLAKLVVSNGETGHTYADRIGVVGEATAETGAPSIGVGGVAKSNGYFPGYGLAGRALVGASSDSGAAIGVHGLSEGTHAGGSNIGFYSVASGGLMNYSFYGNAGDIYNNGDVQVTGLGTFGDLDVDTLNLNGNVISDSTGTISFDNDNLVTTGNLSANDGVFTGDVTIGTEETPADLRGQSLMGL